MKERWLKIIVIHIIAVILLILVFFYFNYRTGISGIVYQFTIREVRRFKPVANVRIEIWESDSLKTYTHSNKKGKFHIHLPGGSYEVIINGDGFITAVFENQEVSRFKCRRLSVTLHQPLGYDESSIAPQVVDTTSVIPRKEKDDIWRTWKNVITGTPHRTVGSAVVLHKSPENKAQAISLARWYIGKYISDNKSINSSLSKINLSTLSTESVRRFKDKWFIHFVQKVQQPFSKEKLLVYGSKADVTISGKDIIEFGFDLFPKIGLESQKIPLSKNDAISKFMTNSDVREIDSSNVVMVIFPKISKFDSTLFQYILGYQVDLVKHVKGGEQPFEVWRTVIDACTGRTLFRERRSIPNVYDRIRASIYEKSPEEKQPVIRILDSGRIGNGTLGFKEIDNNGRFQFYNISDIHELVYQPKNKHFTLFQSGLIESFLFRFFEILPTGRHYYKYLSDSNVMVNPLSVDFVEVTFGVEPQTNTFYHLEHIRNFFIKFGINDWLNIPLNVLFIPDVNNAYYVGLNESLIFGEITESLGLRSDVIYHEYTHGVVNWLIRKDHVGPNPLPYREETGAIDEGIADYFACALNDDPEILIVPHTHLSAEDVNQNIDYDLDYNKDFKIGDLDYGYVHDNSRIFSGIMWDLRTLMTAKFNDKKKGGEFTDELLIEALMIPPAPQSFSDFSINLLLADDNDNRLYTSTPYYQEIKIAFQRHGINIPIFDHKRPTIQNLKFVTIPVSKPSHLEEGRKVRLSAVIHESGYGLDRNSIQLTIDGNVCAPNSIILKDQGAWMRLSSIVNEGEAVRRNQFGKDLEGVLLVTDLAGNKTKEAIKMEIKDTIKPTCNKVDLSFDDDNFYLIIRAKDDGSGINAKRIFSKVDKEKVRIKKDKKSDYEYLLSIKHPHKNKKHTVYIEVSDNAGNTKISSFRVEATGIQSGDCCTTAWVSTSTSVLVAIMVLFYRKRKQGKDNLI